MPTPIRYPNIQSNQPYCTSTDVSNLIGNTSFYQNLSSSQIAAAIAVGQAKLNTQTQRQFSPYRIKQKYDGNGQSSMVLRDSPLIVINELDVWSTYGLNLNRIANDWDLIIDRTTGIISFPPSSNQPIFSPFGFQFYLGNKNINVDATFGYTQEVYGEIPTTTENIHYALANPTAVMNASGFVYDSTVAPTFFPTVYKDNNIIVNTTFVQVNGVWNVQTDNIVYTTNQGSTGITGITFNQAVTGVISVDYSYYYIPSDIIDATAKLAAIVLLTAAGTSLQDEDGLSAADSLQAETSKITWTLGPWGKVIEKWNQEINETIKMNKVLVIPYLGAY